MSRLINFTPLRYPGGKAKLANYVKDIIEDNGLHDGHYIEPYAGGAGVALELLFQEYVTNIHINDISKPIYAFWSSVLNRTDELCRMVSDMPVTVANWDSQKKIFRNPDDYNELELGFATFFLNRTNRSGVLNGGIIGGRDQTGPWKIDARYNPKELINRIESIGKLRNRISLTRKDAVEFLSEGTQIWPENSLIYLDPPYYVKGRALYYDYYTDKDHRAVSAAVSKITKQSWIVSYDNVQPIKDFYCKYRGIIYNLGYSVSKAQTGSEVMFFSDNLSIPELHGAAKFVESLNNAA